MARTLGRREFIAGGVGGVAAVSLGSLFWDDLFGSAEGGRIRAAPASDAGYGPLARPDRNGLRLPEGFRSRLIAQGGDQVPGTSYEWHEASDGSATFPLPDGGFILVSNSEVFKDAGASAIRFDRDGEVTDAYRILDGTDMNCSGGGTPWGTWLSCEEVESGRVWECDPTGRKRAEPRPAMGVFKHEAAAVDPLGRRVYLTEDLINGGLYRFTPERWPDLRAGKLEVARVGRAGRVEWTPVPDPLARRERTRRQVPGSTEFKRGEGMWLDGTTLYIATTGDSRVHAYDTRRDRISVIYDGLATREAPLVRVDQLTASPAGEVFVCEDFAAEEIDIGMITRERRASRFLTATGPQHAGSEMTGACFDPSGRRFFFASQRARGSGDSLEALGKGAIFEVTGPFRRRPS